VVVEERMTKIENVMLRLANVQVDADKRMEGFEENMRRISAAQTETTERLNILVNTVERYISERRNGS
jgi:molybdopterin biosynthesis enzyme MoaB